MSIASSKRLGGLADATTLFVAACGGGGATTAPASEAAAIDAGASEAASTDAGAPAGGAVTGEINVSGSSTVEPISTGVAEALAAGTPVIATDLPVFSEVGGVAVSFVAGDEDEAWSAVLERLLDERHAGGDAWERRRSAARARGSTFSWVRYARDMAAVYREVAGRANAMEVQ